LPHLQKLYDKYRDRGFAMFAINIAPTQNEQIPKWRARGKYTFPVLVTDSMDYARRNFGVLGAPCDMLLNAEGKRVFIHSGYPGGGKEIAIEAEIRELLGLNPFEGLEPDRIKKIPD
jgi:hypothetical protein